MKGLDPELSYTVVCYSDFESTKNYNPNFFLTRNYTLMQGAEYCDFCYHDTRIEEEINHPSTDFWERLE